VKNKYTTPLWLALLILALIESMVHFLPESIGGLLPALFIALSFIVFKNLPIGYRIFHLIFNAQFLLYIFFIMLFSYKDLISGSTVDSAIAYSSFTPVIFVYLFFLLILGLSYLPYYILMKGKTQAT
jgi:hypothetical protein